MGFLDQFRKRKPTAEQQRRLDKRKGTESLCQSQLVYALYGLTPDEIKIVEDSAKR